jgi:hypothetical protein
MEHGTLLLEKNHNPKLKTVHLAAIYINIVDEHFQSQ